MSKYSFNIPKESEVMSEFLRIAEEQKLYNVDTGEDKDGKELIEKAHPDKDSVRVTETYTVDTNLVENLTQQQETDIDVAKKIPDNKISRKVMAELNLQEELTLIADEMKVRGEDDLEVFARKVSKSLEKEGALPLAALVGIIAIPTIISGYLAAVHLTDPIDYGVDTNLDSLYYAIEEYKQTSIENFGGAESSNVEIILDSLEKLISNISDIRKKYMSGIASLANMLSDVPKTREELKNIDSEKVKKDMEDPRTAKVIKYMNGYTEDYNKYIKKIIPELNRMYKYLEAYLKSSEHLVGDETGQRSTWKQLWEKTKEFGEYFYKTDEQHLLDALGIVINSLNGDVQARTNEVKRIVSTMTKPLEEEVSEKFNIEEAKKDIAGTNEPTD